MAAVSDAPALANLARQPQDQKAKCEKQHVSECQEREHHHGRKIHETPLMLSLRDSRPENACDSLSEAKKDQTVAQIPHLPWMEHFPEKWTPVFRKEMRQRLNLA
jgi:hypothetical protein